MNTTTTLDAMKDECDLAELKQLMKLASPLPYEYDSTQTEGYAGGLGPPITRWNEYVIRDAKGRIMVDTLNRDGAITEICGDGPAHNKPAMHDADFMAAACNAIPGLIAEIEHLRDRQQRAPQETAKCEVAACHCEHKLPATHLVTLVNGKDYKASEKCAINHLVAGYAVRPIPVEQPHTEGVAQCTCKTRFPVCAHEKKGSRIFQVDDDCMHCGHKEACHPEQQS